jgi:hypothetical protein
VHRRQRDCGRLDHEAVPLDHDCGAGALAAPFPWIGTRNSAISYVSSACTFVAHPHFW